MKEIVAVPVTPDRAHYLKVCLDHIRAADRNIAIMVGLDRAPDMSGDIIQVCRGYSNVSVFKMPKHDTYGNTFAVMNLLNVAFTTRIPKDPVEIIHYVESDVAVKPDYFAWSRHVHQEHPDIFAACGWVCNLEGPIDMEDYFLAWFYSPCVSWRREMLAKVVEHAKPEYWNDMRRYVLKTFPDSRLHGFGTHSRTSYFEQDAVSQFILERDHLTCAWRRTALCHHIGASGYNRKDGPVFTGTLDERVTKVETLLANPHLRAQLFGKAIVEREIGGPIPKREFRYRIALPGGWQSDLVSELEIRDLPLRLNSADCKDATITRI